MKIDKPITVTKVVMDVFNSIPNDSEFSGLELKRMCVRQEPKLKFTYEETFLRILRNKVRSNFICIDRRKSKYKKVVA